MIEEMHDGHVLKVWTIAAALLLPQLGVAQDYKIAFAQYGKGIFVSNLNGWRARRLTSDAGAILPQYAWSPDGKKILFAAVRKDDEAVAKKVNVPFHFPLYDMDADGSNQRLLFDLPVLLNPRWSPDAKRILFVSAGTLYAGDEATGRYERVAENVTSASWSPDGKTIAFSSHGEIYTSDGEVRQLTKLGKRLANPVWSPDGRQIAFTGGPDGAFVMNADGSDKKRISRWDAVDVTWSPDGTHLLISGAFTAFVCDADGQNGKPLGAGHERIVDSVFTPDSRKVVFRAGPRIYIINADGTDHRTVTEFGGTFAVSPLLR